MTLPLLILHGGADKVTEPDGSRALQKRAKSADKTLKIYDGLFHEVHNEPEQKRVFADVRAWMEERLGDG